MRHASTVRRDKIRPASQLDFPLDEYGRRWERVRAVMADARLDALLLTAQEHVEWLSGFTTVSWRLTDKAFWLVVPLEGEPVLTVDKMHKTNAERTCWVDDTRLWGVGGKSNVDRLTEIFQDLKLTQATVGAELGARLRLFMSQRDWDEIKRSLPRVKFVDAAETLGMMRFVKSPPEIERLRRACEITTNSLQLAYRSMRAGMTEREVMQLMIRDMLRQGADDPYYSTNRGYLALNAGRTDQINPSPIERKLSRGDIVRFDGGGIYQGYSADFIRTAVVEQDPPGELVRANEACRQVMETVLDMIKPGVTSAQIHAAVYEAIRETGYEKKWRRLMDRVSVEQGDMVGHSLGFTMHEYPFITPGDHTVWDVGCVGSVEFCLGEPGTGYACLEDNWVITETGCDVLTSMGRDIWVSGKV
jgi:Xaa-Pro aminopeptidase